MKNHRTTSKNGFTLIELLTVIAIIGVLAAIIIPAVGGVQESALKTKTRSMYGQWVVALEQFKQDYGYIPTFGSSEGSPININDNKDEFIGVLTGELPSGDPSEINTKGISYYSFSNDAFREPGDESTDLVDSFENPNIFMAVDTNRDGEIEDFSPDLDDIDVPDTMRGSVVIWSANPSDDRGYEEVASWE